MTQPRRYQGEKQHQAEPPPSQTQGPGPFLAPPHPWGRAEPTFTGMDQLRGLPVPVSLLSSLPVFLLVQFCSLVVSDLSPLHILDILSFKITHTANISPTASSHASGDSSEEWAPSILMWSDVPVSASRSHGNVFTPLKSQVSPQCRLPPVLPPHPGSTAPMQCLPGSAPSPAGPSLQADPSPQLPPRSQELGFGAVLCPRLACSQHDTVLMATASLSGGLALL